MTGVSTRASGSAIRKKDTGYRSTSTEQNMRASGGMISTTERESTNSRTTASKEAISMGS